MNSFLLAGLKRKSPAGFADDNEDLPSTLKDLTGDFRRKFHLPPHIRHRPNLYKLSSSFPSKPSSSSPALLPPLSFTAEDNHEERPSKKAKFGLACHIESEDSEDDADDESTGSASSDTPSSKRRAVTPPSPQSVASAPTRRDWDFTLTAREAGYIYNCRKSMIDLTSRFAQTSNPEDTDDSESDFESTPNHTPSPAKTGKRQAPFFVPLAQWRYHHQIDLKSPTTPPSTGTKRKMEQSYAAWRQEQPDAPPHPSFSQLPLRTVVPQVEQIGQLEEMETSPVQNYQQQQQLEQRTQEEFHRAPSYSPIILPSSFSQDQQASASAEKTEPFPTNLPSPSVPIRLEPHSAILDHLTARYNAEGPHPQITHVNHATVDQVCASETLGKHLTDRMPSLRAASQRLQAVIGIRNDLPFDLLMGTGQNDAENLVLGPDGGLVDLGLRNTGLSHDKTDDVNGNESWLRAHNAAGKRDGVTSGDAARSNQPNTDLDANAHGNTNINTQDSATTAHFLQNIHTTLDARQSSTYNHQKSATQQREAREVPVQTKPFFPASVNPHTGQGLREYLLTRALITGSTKRECRSISFHDFTPNLRSGEFRNELLEHFGVDGISKVDRIEVVELSLPDTNGTLHPWLSIFIQRPLVTLNPPISACPSTSTPPNFPKPTPTTWLCLAVPIANITSYPVQADTSLPSALLEETLIKNKHGLPTFKVAKRQDYDFSFQGIPIFEFSTRKLFAATSLPSGNEAENENDNNAPIADFLSVDGLKPYDAEDPYQEFPVEVTQNPSLLHSICRKYAQSSGLSGEALQNYGEVIEDVRGVDISEELSPNDGIWWNCFYRGMTRDRIRWEKIRRSMGRGRCRVVMRWQDVPEELKTKDSRLSPRNCEVERIMEEMTRESMQGKKKNTRKSGVMSAGSASGQDVGLGVMHAGGGTRAYSMRSALGEGSRDSLRARAMGNRMGVSGGGVDGGFGTQSLGEAMQGMISEFRG
ncbi:hypothetical protein EYC80_003652 [Monilinia laxa]|uniref:Uncharacterized protein n=1 Tax=Monilinia laxa TaxID=61186 RepID=A0A5N6KKD4_MONLA|nr:hypothetical protein EYC80_003652 [Monilinia laxa]